MKTARLAVVAAAGAAALAHARAWAGGDDERAAQIAEGLQARETFVREQATAARDEARHRARELLRLSRREAPSAAASPAERRRRAVTFDLGVAILRRHALEARALAAEAERLRGQRAGLIDARTDPPAPTIAVAQPVAGALVGPYGRVKEPGTGIEFGRTELQFLARGGDAVRAPAAGTIARIEHGMSGGFEVVMRHEGGYVSVVGGLGEVVVAVGEHVDARVPLGFVGRTADGAPIITWGLWRGRTPVNPRTRSHLLAAPG